MTGWLHDFMFSHPVICCLCLDFIAGLRLFYPYRIGFNVEHTEKERERLVFMVERIGFNI
jgi:hypothetical protein